MNNHLRRQGALERRFWILQPGSEVIVNSSRIGTYSSGSTLQYTCWRLYLPTLAEFGETLIGEIGEIWPADAVHERLIPAMSGPVGSVVHGSSCPGGLLVGMGMYWHTWQPVICPRLVRLSWDRSVYLVTGPSILQPVRLSWDRSVYLVTGPSILRSVRLSCDWTVYLVTGPSILRLVRLSCDWSVYLATGPSILWLVRLSCDRSVYLATGPSVLRLVHLSCDRSVYLVTGPSILWLVHLSCDRSVNLATGPSVLRLVHLSCDRSV